MLTAAVAFGAAVTDVGPEALKALVDALAPRQNSDGTWTYHNALNSLELSGASSRPCILYPWPSCPFLLRFCGPSFDVAVTTRVIMVKGPYEDNVAHRSCLSLWCGAITPLPALQVLVMKSMPA